MSNIWVVPPEWLVTGGEGGGGGTGGTVSWGDIENKPSEFKPRTHTHKLADVENLDTELDSIRALADKKVDKVQGKGLSQEDFTTTLKTKLESIPTGLENGVVYSINGRDGDVVLTSEDVNLGMVLNATQATKAEFEELVAVVDELGLKLENLPDDPSKIVTSVNGQTGEVTITKLDLGLENVDNVKQVSYEEFESSIGGLENLIEANKVYAKSYTDEKVGTLSIELTSTINTGLDKKVDKVVGKTLSTNDFTQAHKNKLEGLPEVGNIVKTVNNIAPILNNITLTKDNIGLDKIQNINYAPKDTLDAHVANMSLHLTLTEKSQLEHLEEDLNLKVDVEEGKQLSTNDFTDEYKKKVENIPSDIAGIVTSVNSKSPDAEGNVNIDKEDIGLSNVLDIEQASKDEVENLATVVESHATELKALDDKITNLDLPDAPVLSVNGKTGNVVITKESIELENVLNIEQVGKEEFNSFKEESGIAILELAKTMEAYTDKEVLSEANRTDSKLLTKVDKELGKQLSSNDFTNAHKAKLDSIDTNKKYVETINELPPDEKGNIQISKATIGLDKVENKEYTPLEDFSSYQAQVAEELQKKIDFVEGKSLSTNDYTDEDKAKLESLSTEIDTGVMTVNELSPDEDGNITIDTTPISVFEAHATDKDIHLQEEQRELINSIPNKVDSDPNKQLSTNDFTDEYKTKIETNSNEIETIKELLGNGEEPVELPPQFKVYKEGHIYGLGGIIYDIVNLNIIKGSLAPRFVYDNLEFFDDGNFSNNTINIYYDGNVAMLENINTEESSYKGKLTDILSKDENVTEKLIVNNKEYTSETRLQYIGNTFNIPIRLMEMHNENGIQQAKIGLNLVNKITFSDTEEAHVSTSIINNTIVNNEITFSQKGDYVIDYESNITYASSEGYTNQVQFMFNVTDNKFLFTEGIEKINKIKYIYDSATLGDSRFGNSAYLNTTIRDNVFDGEVTRVFKEEFTYLSNRQKVPTEPILNNITIDHYLNQQMKLTIGTNFNSNELNREIGSNKQSALEVANLKNIVISSSAPKENYEGLIWYDTSDL